MPDSDRERGITKNEIHGIEIGERLVNFFQYFNRNREKYATLLYQSKETLISCIYSYWR